MRSLRLQASAGPGGVPAGSAARRPPPPSAPPQPGARSPPPPPTVPPFSPQVLKLSLRGDTAAAAALLPLLCLPMDMHCKADPFSAMHREYRRPAPVPARGSPVPPGPVWAHPWPPALRSHLGGHPSFSRSPFRSSGFPHFPVCLKPPVSLPSVFCHPYFFYLPSYLPWCPSPSFLPPAS